MPLYFGMGYSFYTNLMALLIEAPSHFVMIHSLQKLAIRFLYTASPIC